MVEIGVLLSYVFLLGDQQRLCNDVELETVLELETHL